SARGVGVGGRPDSGHEFVGDPSAQEGPHRLEHLEDVGVELVIDHVPVDLLLGPLEEAVQGNLDEEDHLSHRGFSFSFADPSGATVPAEPSTTIRSPVAIRVVASGTPTTAGIPYSRATTAPCDIIPPISITSALAVRKSGVHPGSVAGATRTSPGSSRAPAGENITCATPRAVPGDAGVPRIAPSAAGDVNAASASVPSDRSTRGT